MSDPHAHTQSDPLDTPSEGQPDPQTRQPPTPRASLPEARAGSRNPQNERLGLLLVGAGALFLLARFSVFDFGDVAWPLFVLVPGVLLLALALRGGERAALAVPGAVVSAVGLILFWQNATDRFETWAYLWALIPAAAAGGAWLSAHLRHDGGDTGAGAARKARARRDATRALGLLAVFAIFFEVFIFGGLASVLGGVLGSALLPLALIALGLYLLKPWNRRRA